METKYQHIKESFSKEAYLKIKDKQDINDQNLDLIAFDLIPSDDPDRPFLDAKLEGETPFASIKESKVIACFAGVAIGDALGSFLEGVRLDYTRNYFQGFENIHETLQKEDLDILRCQPGQYTDDTSMSLCLADSLILHNLNYNGPDTRFRFFHWYFSGYNNGRNKETDPAERYSVGIGGTTYNSCMDFAKNPMPKVPNYGKNGKQNANGTIMRFAPIPIALAMMSKKAWRLQSSRVMLHMTVRKLLNVADY